MSGIAEVVRLIYRPGTMLEHLLTLVQVSAMIDIDAHSPGARVHVHQNVILETGSNESAHHNDHGHLEAREGQETHVDRHRHQIPRCANLLAIEDRLHKSLT